jgi:hypothetical protein
VIREGLGDVGDVGDVGDWGKRGTLTQSPSPPVPQSET